MKILFITLSNIGDVILTLPVLDALRDNLREAHITVMVGPRPKEIFQNNPCIERVIVYDKHASFKEKINLWRSLRNERFDIVVDLRNSFFGLLLAARHKTSPFLFIPAALEHMKERHLYKIRRIISALKDEKTRPDSSTIYFSPQDESYIDNLLRNNGITAAERFIVVSAGARSHTKRWSSDKFLELSSELNGEFRARVVLVGDKDDIPINRYISQQAKDTVVDLTAKTSLAQLASLLKRAGVVITNDSAVLHLSSYLNTPTVAIFGPSNENKYGPWSERKAVVKKDIFCRPCEKAQCRFATLQCLQVVNKEDVLRQVRKILGPPAAAVVNAAAGDLERILVVRTDRIGDVLLSTPVIKALRENYPHAYIAVMVSPYSKDIVEGNPYLDEVIIYDKEGKHRSWRRTLKFARNLKKKRFDLALVLHPTNRVHLITLLAAIPRRVGYDRKLGFLLTDRIVHLKHLGEKHELEYTLDLLRYVGIEPQDKNPFMPIREDSERWADKILRDEEVGQSDKLLALHPGASCPSKIWPYQRFAEVADKLNQKYGFKILVLAGPKELGLAEKLISHMQAKAVNLAGRTSVSQLASILKRCRLFISNDSGPVHIASAVGVPVISIFGRGQEGLSPQRWGSLGLKDKILHKKIGCIECLAHNCVKNFACLKAITVDDVMAAADSILRVED